VEVKGKGTEVLVYLNKLASLHEDEFKVLNLLRSEYAVITCGIKMFKKLKSYFLEIIKFGAYIRWDFSGTGRCLMIVCMLPP